MKIKYNLMVYVVFVPIMCPLLLTYQKKQFASFKWKNMSQYATSVLSLSFSSNPREFVLWWWNWKAEQPGSMGHMITLWPGQPTSDFTFTKNKYLCVKPFKIQVVCVISCSNQSMLLTYSILLATLFHLFLIS